VYTRVANSNVYYRTYNRMYFDENDKYWRVKTLSVGTFQNGDMDGAGNHARHRAHSERSCCQCRLISQSWSTAVVRVPEGRASRTARWQADFSARPREGDVGWRARRDVEIRGAINGLLENVAHDRRQEIVRWRANVAPGECHPLGKISLRGVALRRRCEQGVERATVHSRFRGSCSKMRSAKGRLAVSGGFVPKDGGVGYCPIAACGTPSWGLKGGFESASSSLL
jgi:hypothetical protein